MSQPKGVAGLQNYNTDDGINTSKKTAAGFGWNQLRENQNIPSYRTAYILESGDTFRCALSG